MDGVAARQLDGSTSATDRYSINLRTRMSARFRADRRKSNIESGSTCRYCDDGNRNEPKMRALSRCGCVSISTSRYERLKCPWWHCGCPPPALPFPRWREKIGRAHV